MEYFTGVDNFVLEDATRADVADILELIRSIASYEKMNEQVTASIESLTESLFDKKRAYVILAKENKKIIGYMLYFYNYSTFTGSANLYLEDIFLQPEYRHKGYGKIMFQTLARIGVKENVNRIDWVCLDWNKIGLSFYEKIGAHPLKEWVVHRLEKKEILKLSKM